MLAFLGMLPLRLSAARPVMNDSALFRGGEGGYHTYRIPALIVTTTGTLLAFCEGRHDSSSDTGNIDVLVKRSLDNGATWSSARVVADFGDDTVGNPAPVVDRSSRKVWLLLTSNPGQLKEPQITESTGTDTRRVWVTHSGDDGVSWAAPVEITSSVKRPDWTWYATGPGNGIQLSNGRLVVPCDHVVKGDRTMHSHVIYSDDHGGAWKIGGSAGDKTNESAVVELADHSLLLNMRNYRGDHRRAIAFSRDGGLTWSEARSDPALVEPVCQASMVRFTLAGKRGKNRLLFSNPADTRRANMTVRLSYDEGKTWPVSMQIYAGPSAYSSLAVLSDRTIGLLYERGEKGPYEEIRFAHFNLEWLTDGADNLSKR